ncbi:MAG: hypothetical protein M0042_00895 [Nitrospiraceae bacterium]|nr:hypothetical protein [Nitrospiraceae bacterium]
MHGKKRDLFDRESLMQLLLKFWPLIMFVLVLIAFLVRIALQS